MVKKTLTLSEDAPDMSIRYLLRNIRNKKVENVISSEKIVSDTSKPEKLDDLEKKIELIPSHSQIINPTSLKLVDYTATGFDAVKGIITFNPVQELASKLNDYILDVSRKLGQDVPTQYISGPLVDSQFFTGGKKLSQLVTLLAVFPDDMFYAHSKELNSNGSEPVTMSFAKYAIDTCFGSYFDPNKHPEYIIDIAEPLKVDCFGLAFRVDASLSSYDLLRTKYNKLSSEDTSINVIISDKTSFDFYRSRTKRGSRIKSASITIKK